MFDFKQFATAFVEEAKEKIAELEDGFLRLEQAPCDKELLDTIFRAAHTIKGSSGTMGLEDLSKFTHKMEGVLSLLRDLKITPDKELLDLLLEATDMIKEMLESVASDTPFDYSRGDSLASRMEAIKGCEVPVSATPPVLKQYRILFVLGQNLFARGLNPALVVRDLRKLGEIVSIKADTNMIPLLQDIEPTRIYVKWDIHFKTSGDVQEIRKVFEFFEDGSEIKILPFANTGKEDIPFLGQMLVQEGKVRAEDIEEALKSQKRLGEILVEKGSVTSNEIERVVEKQRQTRIESFKNTVLSTIRVDLKKLDHLMNTVGEMIIIHSMLKEALYEGHFDNSSLQNCRNNSGIPGFSSASSDGLEQILAQLQRIGDEIQGNVMSLRMLPVGDIFQRFKRLIRDLADNKHKNVELIITGEDTELDKGVLEKIADPLVHLIRNAVDHGIEIPEERVAAGKSAKGTVHLSGYQLGDYVYIEVEDDGRGLDREKIIEKAISRGLISNADGLSDDQVFSMIFLPGFSTADQVTDVSGRGVGMDVVKRNVDALNGKLYIKTHPGHGTTMSIKLPLTLAIIDGLTLTVGEEVFIIPVSAVSFSLRPHREDIKTLGERGELINIRGTYVPLIRLHETLDMQPRSLNPWDAIVVVVLHEGREYGLLVDDLIGQQQVVIKNIGTSMPKVCDISGGTILGNGKVALVLDVPEIVEYATAACRPALRAAG